MEEVAGPTGLEPATSGVTGLRSNQLSYDPAMIDCMGLRSGGRYRTRTCDILRVKQTLYRLS